MLGHEQGAQLQLLCFKDTQSPLRLASASMRFLFLNNAVLVSLVTSAA